jgi:hypothetical protein
MFQQFRDRFLGLSSEFRRVSNPQQATELASRLCSMLADISGSLINLQNSFDGLEADVDSLTDDVSGLINAQQPETIEYTFEPIVDSNFETMVSTGQNVWFQETDQGVWVSGLFLADVPNSRFSVIRHNDQETLIETDRLFTREEPLRFPN